MQGRVLVIAGSDSGGGAGIQGDIKTVTALGAYASTAITALTAQSTEGVFAVENVAPDFIARQIDLALSDIGADAIKTGMLHNAEVIEAVCGALARKGGDIPIVVDPVMVAKGGQSLLDIKAIGALKRDLIVKALIVTPNTTEAESLMGMDINNFEDMQQAAKMVATLGPKAVLLKGGHLTDAVVTDIYVEDGEMEYIESPRIDTVHTHGTGCALASAIATGLAQGMALRAAVLRAHAYVQEAIRTAPGLGHGHGPLNHAHTVKPFQPQAKRRIDRPSSPPASSLS